jgi:hypothetical protein
MLAGLPKDIDENWYLAVLEEYKSLRHEAVTARDAQLSVLRLSVPLLGVLIGLGVTLKTESVLGAFLLSIVVPAIVIMTLELWIGEIQRSVRAGSAVAAIEQRLSEIFAGYGLGPPMGWERWLRSSAPPLWPTSKMRSQQERDFVFHALIISGFLLVIAVGSCALGLHFLWHDGHKALMWATMGMVSLALLLITVRAPLAVRGLIHRNRVPSRQELWPDA